MTLSLTLTPKPPTKTKSSMVAKANNRGKGGPSVTNVMHV